MAVIEYNDGEVDGQSQRTSLTELNRRLSVLSVACPPSSTAPSSAIIQFRRDEKENCETHFAPESAPEIPRGGGVNPIALPLRIYNLRLDRVLLRLVKMDNNAMSLINTRLQPGGASVPASEPFQRLAGAEETVETVLTCFAGHHRAEARC